jgi:D-erythronate 2-dehydrogenase
MHVVITGGAGFLGLRLAKELLKRDQLIDARGVTSPITSITLVDIVAADLADPRVTMRVGDTSSVEFMKTILTDKVDAVFHLAAIVSGHAEAEFDLGMRINLDASRILLECCREGGKKPKVVFTSSVAVYGGDMPEVVQESTALNPQTSYGSQKAMAELLLNDYTRKGFIDGRVLRLPTISVRPGKPNLAASSFASGIIREPLSGQESICPVAPETKIWVLSPKKAVLNLIHGHDIPTDILGRNRAVNLPGLSMQVSGMLSALEKVAGQQVLKRVQMKFDPSIDKLVSSWPGAWNDDRARSIGFVGDANFEEVIQAHIDDELNGRIL